MPLRSAPLLLRAVAGLAALFAAVSPASGTSPKEYELKAAFLYNFTKFVTWPPRCFPNDSAPLVIGVYGQNPFSPGLVDAFRHRKIDARSIELRSIATVDEALNAHLVFIPATENGDAEEILKRLRSAPVLTVGETPEFREHGGIITFIVEDGKLRFAIGMTEAQSAGLKISAQLQKLAHSVQRNP